MPISNLMIQRRRLNELRRLGFDDIEPDKADDFEMFRLYKGILTRDEIDELSLNGFILGYLSIPYSGKGKGQKIEILVKKSAPEKRKSIPRVEITN